MSRPTSPNSLNDRLQIRIRRDDKAVQEEFAALRGFDSLADYYRSLVDADMQAHPDLLTKARKSVAKR